jgi:hypothetical protein
MNQVSLAKMTAEISEVVRKHIPGYADVVLRSDSSSTAHETLATTYAFNEGNKAAFAIRAEFRTTLPENLNLKCVTRQ